MALLPSFKSVFQLDLFSVLVKHLCWSSLISLAHWPSFAPSLVQPELRSRVLFVMAFFLPDDLIPAFFDLLDGCEGVVFGATVRQILLLDTFDSKALALPLNLDIAVAPHGYQKVVEWFLGMGFETRPCTEPCTHHLKMVRDACRLMKIVGGKVGSIA